MLIDNNNNKLLSIIVSPMTFILFVSSGNLIFWGVFTKVFAVLYGSINENLELLFVLE